MEGWKAALITFEKAIELNKGGDGNDWFFPAMAHWQNGQKASGAVSPALQCAV
jgi:hypothetical protein